jgi:hypothetical protein
MLTAAPALKRKNAANFSLGEICRVYEANTQVPVILARFLLTTHVRTPSFETTSAEPSAHGPAVSQTYINLIAAVGCAAESAVFLFVARAVDLRPMPGLAAFAIVAKN